MQNEINLQAKGGIVYEKRAYVIPSPRGGRFISSHITRDSRLSRGAYFASDAAKNANRSFKCKMGKLTRHFFIFSMLSMLAGCANIHQQIISAARQPGQQTLTTPEALWKQNSCEKARGPSVTVESLEVLPEKVKPGARVNYRLIYAMCPASKFSETVSARVNRSLLYKGQEVARNVKDNLELRAGRWAVDSFLTLPPETPLGVYALALVVETPGGRSPKFTRSFVVSDEFYLSGE